MKINPNDFSSVCNTKFGVSYKSTTFLRGTDCGAKNGGNRTSLVPARQRGDTVKNIQSFFCKRRIMAQNFRNYQTTTPAGVARLHGTETDLEIDSQLNQMQIDNPRSSISNLEVRKRANSNNCSDDEDNGESTFKNCPQSWENKATYSTGGLKYALHGNDYQLKLLMLFATRSSTNRKVCFRLATEMAAAEKFDDLVFRQEFDDGKVKYRLLQAKHKQHLERDVLIKVSDLKTEKDDDFSLQKYFIAYLKDIRKDVFQDGEIEAFIICTNTSFDFQPKERELKKTKNDKDNWKKYFEVCETQDEILDLGGVRYKFDVKEIKQISNELKPIFFRALLRNVDVLQEIFSESEISDLITFNEAQGQPRNDDKKWDVFLTNRNSLNEKMDELISGFFNKIVFALNQPSGRELDDKIKSLIGAEFNLINDITYNEFYSFMSEWMQHRIKGDYAHFLTHDDVLLFFKKAKEKLASLVLSSTSLYKARINNSGLAFSESCYTMKRITKFLHPDNINHKILLLSSQGAYLSGMKVVQLFERFKDRDCKIFATLNSLHQLLETDADPVRAFESDATKYLVVEHDSVLKNDSKNLLKMFLKIDKKIIIITPQKHKKNSQQIILSILKEISRDTIIMAIEDRSNDFTDLTEASQEIVLQKEIIFQGSAAKIKSVFDDSLSRKLIDKEIISSIVLNKSVHIGRKLSDLADIKYYYIQRSFHRNVNIKCASFTSNHDDVFAITEGTENVLSSIEIRANVCDFRSRDTNSTITHKVFKINHETQPQICFQTLCNENPRRAIHLLDASLDPTDSTEASNANISLVWKQSRVVRGGSFNNLRCLLNENDTGCEHQPGEITDITDKIVILSAEAGMGKSTVLTKLANGKSSNSILWIERINLNDHTSKFHHLNTDGMNEDDAIEFLIKVASFKTDSQFEKEYFKHCIKSKGKIAILFDGFDEISPLYTEKVLNLFRIIQETKVEKLWITTRPHMRYEIEDTLGALSFTLKPLSKKDQRNFLKMYFSKRCSVDENRLKEYIECLLALLSESIADKERIFTGIPLQTKMVAEAFLDNFREFCASNEKPNLPSKLNLLDLFERFIEEKYKIYRREKKKQDFTNTAVNVDDKVLHSEFMQRHKLLALYTIFERNVVETLLSAEENNATVLNIKKIQNGEEKVGIIVQVVDGKPEFTHRIFAEFFAALWLTDSLEKHNVKQFLQQQLFKGESEILKNFFDRILSKENDAHMAALNNDLQYFKGRTNFDGTDRTGRTALHLAASHGHIDILEYFLTINKLHAQDQLFEWTPLQYAMQARQWKCGEILLGNGAKQEDLSPNTEATDDRGGVAVHTASELGLPNLVGGLLKAGLDVNARDACRWTSLHRAAEEGELETVTSLMENGANVDAIRDDGWSPLHNAIYEGRIHVVRFLIKRGANLNVADIPRGFTPLHWALARNQNKIATLLIKKGADVNIVDLKGNSPVHLAAERGLKEILISLTEKGASISLKNKNNQRPIHLAAYYGHLDLVAHLTGEMQPGFTNEDVKYAMCRAAAGGELNVVKFFVDNDVEIDLKDDRGYTSLYLAAAGGHGELVTYLLRKGADVFTSTPSGTVLNAAVSSSDTNVVTRILTEIQQKSENLDEDVNVQDPRAGNTPLMSAVASGKIHLCTLLMEFNVDVNLKNFVGDTALHLAVKEGDSEMLQFLCDNAADAAIANTTSQTPLKLALKHLVEAVGNENNGEKVEKLKEMIDILLKVHHPDDVVLSLSDAVCIGSLEIVKSFVAQGESEISAADEKGFTPLHWAAHSGHTNIIEYLLDKDADSNAQDHSGCVPLHVAAKAGHKEAVKILLKQGVADVRNECLWTPLHYAAENGHTEVVEYLVGQGADVNATRDDGWIPLHNAVYMDQVKVVRFLANSVECIDLKDLSFGRTPLHWAILRDTSEDLVKALLGADASVSATDESGNTALHMAAQRGAERLMESLLGKGADVNLDGEDGQTPLHMAARGDSGEKLKFVQYIFSRCDRVQVNKKDDDEWTALHLASRDHSEPGIVAALLAGGADVNVKGDNDWTPLHLACKGGHPQIVKVLVEKGACLENLTVNQKTPLDVAADNGFWEIFDFLVERRKSVDDIAMQ